MIMSALQTSSIDRAGWLTNGKTAVVADEVSQKGIREGRLALPKAATSASSAYLEEHHNGQRVFPSAPSPAGLLPQA